MDLRWKPHVRIGRIACVFLDRKVRHTLLAVLKIAWEHLAIYFCRDEIPLQVCDVHGESRRQLPFVQFPELRNNPVPCRERQV